VGIRPAERWLWAGGGGGVGGVGGRCGGGGGRNKEAEAMCKEGCEAYGSSS